MSDRNLTRRRVVQGAGVIGVTGLLGTATAAAQEGNDTGQTETPTGEQTAAIRVAHAGADAPSVDVRLTSTVAGDGGVDGTETDGENATGDGGDGPSVVVNGLGFGGVSNYREVDPGTYRLRVVVSNGDVLDQILDIFGGDGGDETVIYEDSVELEAGTAYTAVAYGQLSAGPATDDGLGGDTGGGTTGNETDGGLFENGTAEGTATSGEGLFENGTNRDPDGTNETGGVDSTVGGAASRGFRVERLEDDLSAPPEGTARVRLFNAVPDAGAVSVTQRQPTAGTAADGNVTGGVTTTDGGVGSGEPTTDGDGSARVQTETTLVEGLAFGESQTVEIASGRHSLRISPATSAETEGGLDEATETDGGGLGEETETGTESGGFGGNQTDGTGTGAPDNSVEVQLSLDGGAVYSSLAIGYFDPTGAAAQRDQAETGGTGETDTVSGGTQTDGDGGTAGGNQTSETETATLQAQDVQTRAIELVTVKSSQDGTRVAGGNRNLL